VNQPAPILHISPEIEDKIFQKHGITGDKARQIFEAHWTDAKPHPFDPNDPPPDGSEPRFVIQQWDITEASFWFLVFVLFNLDEAELVTCFRRPHKRRWPKFWRTK
jgi:hypothetical protein